MPDYGRYCPVSMGSEVLADRWTPLVVRELLLGNTRFNDIARCLPGISRSLLVQRLRHLERCGVVETWPSPTGRGSEYHLTPAGKDLSAVIETLGRWAVAWRHDEFSMDDVEAAQLMWWMHRHVSAAEALPPGRVVVQFDHTAPERITIWLVLDRGEASVCMQHPGFESDVIVTTPTPLLASVFAGVTSWRDAQSSGMTIAGAPALVRALPRWFGLSAFADDVRRQAKQLSEARSA